MVFPEPTEQMFNFNNPFGACPECEGFGKTMGIDEKLVVPNKNLSLYEDAVAPWRGPTLSMWKNRFINTTGNSFPVHKPYRELSDEEMPQPAGTCFGRP